MASTKISTHHKKPGTNKLFKKVTEIPNYSLTLDDNLEILEKFKSDTKLLQNDINTENLENSTKSNYKPKPEYSTPTLGIFDYKKEYNRLQSLQPEVFTRCIDLDIVDNIKQTFDNYAYYTNDYINNTMGSVNNNIYLINEMWGSVSKSINILVEENIHIGQKLLECKNMSDALDCQQQALTDNIKHVTELMLDSGNKLVEHFFEQSGNNINALISWSKR